jgi:nucleobase transporter 1/2
MIVFGLFSKFGALFLTMPEPIVGGIFCVMFGMIAAVGLSNLQFVDMNSTRNLFVLGFSVFFGLVSQQFCKCSSLLHCFFNHPIFAFKVISKWMQKNSTAIQLGEGYEILSQVITVMLSTSMFVSGFLGFFLDNTVPGTPEERGLVKWRAQFEVSNEGEAAQNSCYELPFGMEWLRKMSWTKYIPCLPTFQGFNLNKVLPIGNSNKTN